MERVHIKEANSEILIFLDYNHSTKLSALKEAVRILQREVIRVESNPNNHIPK